MDVPPYTVCFFLVAVFVNGICGEENELIRQLIARVKDLEKQGAALRRHNALQDDRLRVVESALRGKDGLITALLEQVRRQGELLADLQPGGDREADLQPGVDTDRGTSRGGEAESGDDVRVRSLERKLPGVRQGRLVAEGPVAFHARIDKYPVAHIGVNQKLVFDVVTLNLGGGYHPQSGVFIAPTAGLYLFSASVLTEHAPHVEFQAELVKNGSLLARIYGHADSGHDQGSVTAAALLAAGDEVWVSLRGPTDDSIWGDAFTSFTGILVMYA